MPRAIQRSLRADFILGTHSRPPPLCGIASATCSGAAFGEAAERTCSARAISWKSGVFEVCYYLSQCSTLIDNVIFRPFAYSYIVDILVALRSDLTPQQIWQVVHVYCVLLHNPYLLMNTQAIFSKLIFNMVDAIAAKDTAEGATALIKYILITCTEKLKALVLMIEDVGTKMEKVKDEKPKEIKESEAIVNATMIEKERPLASSPYSTENTEDAIKGQSRSSINLSPPDVFSRVSLHVQISFAGISDVYDRAEETQCTISGWRDNAPNIRVYHQMLALL